MSKRTWNKFPLELSTAEDMDILANSRALIEHLEQQGMDIPLVHQVFRLQQARNLSIEHTLALLAYYALLATERTEKSFIDHMNTCTKPMIFTIPKS